jgi:hypothetical protein
MVASVGIDRESDAATLAMGGVPLRRDRDEIGSFPLLLHPPLHHLAAGVGQRVRAQHAGEGQRFSPPGPELYRPC